MTDSEPPQLATEVSEGPCHVSLTHDPLNVNEVMDRVRSPSAGAIVIFAGKLFGTTLGVTPLRIHKKLRSLGTTRDSFNGKEVSNLTYTSYPPRALRSLLSIATTVRAKHSLTSISITHRLGLVPIGEESILIAVSSPHRQAAWRAGEESLELCKEKVEVWKREEFADGEGVWRANRDGAIGQRVDK